MTDEKGQKHRFPDEATPEMIAQALGVKPPQAPYAEAGQRVAGKTQFEKNILGTGPNFKGGGTAAVNTLKNQGMGMAQGEAQNALLGPIPGQIQRAKNTWDEITSGWQRGKGDARAQLGEAVLGGLGSLVGVSAKQQAENAARGEGGKIIGETGVPAAETLATYGASKFPFRAAKNATASTMRYPATARQSQLGRPGAVKNFLPPWLQKYTVPEGLIPKGELGTPTNPGQFNEIPSKMPKQAAPEVFPVSQSPGPYRGPSSIAGTVEPEVFPLAKSPGPYRGPASVPKPEPHTPSGAPLPDVSEYYANRGAEENAILTRQQRLDRMSAKEEPVAPETTNAEGPAPPTGKLYKLPVPREPLPGENPAYMASTKRNRLLNLSRQGRPGAGDQLRNIGNTVLYTPEQYPGPRETVPLQGNPTPFSQPLKVENAMGVRWASDGTNRVSIPQGVADEEIESYARPKLAQQAQIASQLPWMKGQQ